MHLLIKIALVALATSSVWASPQSQTPATTSVEQKQQPVPNNTVVVNGKRITLTTGELVEPNPPVVIKAAEAPEHKASYLSSEWSLVWVTIFLALTTLGLAIYTGKLYSATVDLGDEAKKSDTAQTDRMEKSIKEAARAATAMEGFSIAAHASAKAAEQSLETLRDEFVATHRPKIRIRHVYGKGDFWRGGQMTIGTQIVNVGLTEAIIVGYFVRAVMVKSDEGLPAIPKYGDRVSPVQETMLESGVFFDLQFLTEPTVDIPHAYLSQFWNDKMSVHCFGYIQYRDTMGFMRTTAFSRRWRTPAFTARDGFAKFVAEKDVDTDYDFED